MPRRPSRTRLIRGGSAAAATPEVVGYYPNWAIYSARNYQPQDLPWSDLTVVSYAFMEIGNCGLGSYTPVGPNPTQQCLVQKYQNGDTMHDGQQDYKLYSLDPYADFVTIPSEYGSAGAGKGTMAAITGLAKQHGVTALLSIGGWSLSYPFAEAISASDRSSFIQSILDFLDQAAGSDGNAVFDGIDIDWEPPQTDAYSDDAADFADFIQELRQALDGAGKQDLWITQAGPANPAIIAAVGAANWQTLAANLDYVFVMAYDFHGGFDLGDYPATDHAANLVLDPQSPAPKTLQFSGESTIAAYEKMGVPAHQLVLGVPAYGRAYSGVTAPSKVPGETVPGLYYGFTGTPPGQFNDGTGVYNYNYILANLAGQGSWQGPTYDKTTVGTSLYDPSATGTSPGWLSFDDVQAVQAKINWVNQNGLAGMMMWDLSGDVPPSDSDYDKLSLIHAIKSGLTAATEAAGVRPEVHDQRRRPRGPFGPLR